MIQTALLAGWGTAVFAASAAVQQAKPRYKAPVRTSPGKTYIPNVDPEDLCPVCEGTCKVFCQACSGNGRVNCTDRVLLPKGEWPKWCSGCRGSGRWFCPSCVGTGIRKPIAGPRLPDTGKKPKRNLFDKPEVRNRRRLSD
mmetsp:Transcript_7095/g.20784  ORF Transcript_7095/g.20784 Transcript_7095/m.20784 type:complete len:141 (-) Transcript_7095:5350-5772(-)